MNSIATNPPKAPAPAHSPVPWRPSVECPDFIRSHSGNDDAGIPITEIVAILVGPKARTNRDLIIRAVNHFGPMLQALKVARHAIEFLDGGTRMGPSLNALDAINEVLRDLSTPQPPSAKPRGVSAKPGLLARLPAVSASKPPGPVAAHGVCDDLDEQARIDQAMDDINDGGDDDPAQYSSSKEA